MRIRDFEKAQGARHGFSGAVNWCLIGFVDCQIIVCVAKLNFISNRQVLLA